MKLRLIQDGFADYTGQMGVTFFEDGLSTADVKVSDAVRMSAVMLCEWEDGTSASVTQSILDNANTPAPDFQGGAEQHNAEAKLAGDVIPEEQRVTHRNEHTMESLSAIADKEGIKGLRAIADSMNIKSNSIKELIRDILNENKA